jgi:hypothetical protein
MSSALKIAVITGGHGYDVPNFHRLFRSLDGVDAYIQHLDDFACSSGTVRDGYDVVLFYIMLRSGPTDEGQPWYCGKPKSALEHLGATRQGIVVLHHAILAYPDWPVWNDIVGIADRKFGYHVGQSIRVNIDDANHPITAGVAAWDMTDETYTMADAGEGSHIVLSVDHPRSMKHIAWTRQRAQSRVFCFQSGHDNVTWANPAFQKVLLQGIRWSANKG